MITMVTYQKWTQIAFEVARSKGMQNSQENSQQLISVVADIWNREKETLSSATVAQARDTARAEITVR